MLFYVRLAVLAFAVIAISAIGGSTGKSEDVAKSFFWIMTYFGLPAFLLLVAHKMWGK
jgi:hypothetical protein